MTTRARLRIFAFALVALVLLAGGLPVESASADAGAEAQFVELINQARASSGKGALTTNSELTSVARRWAQHMADEQKLSHNPNLANEVTQDWEKLGENVGFGQEVGQIHNAFMNSAPHRANILDGAFTHVGVGVVVDGSGQMWVTEVFMRLRGGGTSSPTTAAPSPPPTTAPQPTTSPPTTSPPTTRAPRVTAPTTVRTGSVPTTLPASTTPPVTASPTTTPPEPTAPATPAAPTPTMRLVLVLGGLHDLDQGR
ncbi:MAG TPA: CAP domain-containing protein [Acidimicrobiales bacterium]|nr:CAP domain-containing protein [Acidimicrobiales bacterium]